MTNDTRTYADRREYQLEYQRAYKARKKAEFFEGRFCVSCGATEELQVDHIVPRQGSAYRPVWLLSRERQIEEMKLCQILCVPCHLNKTISDMIITHGFVPYTHGTVAMYHRHKCRCDLCRAFYSKWQRKYHR